MARTRDKAAAIAEPMIGDRWVKNGKDRTVDGRDMAHDGTKFIEYSGSWCCVPVIRLRSFRRWASTATYLGNTEDA